MSIAEALLLLDKWRWVRLGSRSASVYVRATSGCHSRRVAVRRARSESLEAMIVRLAERALKHEMKPEPSRGERIAAALGIRLD